MKNQTQPQPAPQTSYAIIPLAEIAIGKNTRSEFDQDDINELAASIKLKGVLEPILVRPFPGNKTKYQLVFGERRYRASKIAGKTDIPSTIRLLTDEEVLEIQITENLMRKDISPLDEAAAFKALLDTGKFNVQELCARIGKEKDYINRRLHLNEMIPEFKKMLHQNKMLLGHAFLLCRLPQHEQTNFYNELKKNNGLDIVHQQTVTQLQEEIDREIVRKLDSATFKTTDEKLVPEAGACTNCLKRSGANPMLFPDVKPQDRCYDKTCYQKKTDISFKRNLDEAIANPDVMLVCGWNKDTTEAKELRKKGHIVLTEYNEYNNAASAKTPGAKKAFHVSGSQRGHYGFITIIKRDKAVGKTKSPKEIQEEIDRQIKDGRARDRNIIFEKIEDRLHEIAEYDGPDEILKPKPLKPVELTIANVLLLDRVNHNFGNDDLKMKEDNPDYVAALSKAPPALLARIVRSAIIDFIESGCGDTEKSVGLALAREYFPKELKEWETAQAKVREAREAKLTAKPEKNSIKPKAKKP